MMPDSILASINNNKRKMKMVFRILLLLFYLSKTEAICPSHCSCFLDTRGRMAVSCAEGGLTGSLTLENFNTSIEVLRISAPEDNMNMLTMSPAFQAFKNLEEIHITRCNIPILGAHFFYTLQKLEVLNLSQNNISQILDHNFLGLKNLRELNLDDNRISSMPSGTFRHLQNLKVLSLQRNKIRELTPRIFLEVKRLRVLKLSGNGLGELNKEVFKDIEELRVLECRGCALRKIDEMFHLLPQLTHLDLGFNEIRFLASNEFNLLPNLRILKLDGNRLTAILGHTFSDQPELKKLNLAKNHIAKIDQMGFYNMNNLSDLDIGFNKLEYLDPDVFGPISDTLQRLVLSGNQLRLDTIKNVVENLGIQELHLAEMGLTSINQKIFPESLKILHLESNSLYSISHVALPNGLTEFDISKNKLRGLKEEVVQKVEFIEKLRLHSNPWSCDLCHIVPLLERTNRSKVIHDIKCVSPFTADGKLLGTLRRSELTWCSTASYESGDVNYFPRTEENSVGLIAAGASVLLLCSLVVFILAILCYSRRHAAKYYTHEEKFTGERDSIFENQSPLFGDDKELSFKFPLNSEDKRISVSTIDEIKKEISNGLK